MQQIISETAAEEAKLNAGGRETVEGLLLQDSSSTRTTLEALRCIEKDLMTIDPANIKHVNPSNCELCFYHTFSKILLALQASVQLKEACVIISCSVFSPVMRTSK